LPPVSSKNVAESVTAVAHSRSSLDVRRLWTLQRGRADRDGEPMNGGYVLAVGEPLDGNIFALPIDPGESIQLNTPAGPCIYRFADPDEGALIRYVGPVQETGLLKEEL
jgi:hypothetical protein